MAAVNVVLCWMIIMMMVLACVSCIGIVNKVWAEIHEYETMKARGYRLFKDDEGKYWWVD
jgi:hypothetical protein